MKDRKSVALREANNRRQQRSRRKLPAGAVCYLCGQPIASDDSWDRDHVPPERFFGASVKQQFNPQLEWLYTHRACNQAYRTDEDYFVVTFAGHARSLASTSVIEDLRRAFAMGHSHGIIRQAIANFGRIELADGLISFQYDAARVRRVIWKLVRGVYFLELNAVLPEHQLHAIVVTNRLSAPERLALLGPIFPMVRDTEGMGRYPGVFDFKWVGVADGESRQHIFALLMWDGVIAVVLCHDARCRCAECVIADDAPPN